MDGKLILVTNVPDLAPADVVARYKALADIERGFRVLKSEIDIAPVYHRLPNRIRAHALLCFLALVLYRVLRMRLKDRGNPCSPERVGDRTPHSVPPGHPAPAAHRLRPLDAECRTKGALRRTEPSNPDRRRRVGQKRYPCGSKINDLHEKVSNSGAPSARRSLCPPLNWACHFDRRLSAGMLTRCSRGRFRRQRAIALRPKAGCRSHTRRPCAG
jgi:Transposase DDE domain